MWHTKNAFFPEMQFWSHCYTVVSYQALFRLSVYKIPAVYLSGAKNVCFARYATLVPLLIVKMQNRCSLEDSPYMFYLYKLIAWMLSDMTLIFSRDIFVKHILYVF